MSDYKIRSGKLSFKGDSKKKKKKRKDLDEVEQKETPESLEGWIPVESLDDLTGPIFILFKAEHAPVCIHTVEDSTSLHLSPLSVSLSDAEPTDVQQVFLAQRLMSGEYAFKTSDGKYLSCDKFGELSVGSTAVGPLESWAPVVKEAGIAFQTPYQKFLSVDEVAGGGLRLRGDAETIGFCELFQVKFQARNKRRAKKEAKEIVNEEELEVEQIKRFHAWGGGKIVTSKEDTRELKRAKKEGKLSEAMLDRRVKLKSDKFCK
ncbi:uncharacterized protein VTP21DRAFT_6515 [Calcarisporiella thermophila]|uniref:uncharacterized protein n=1 Tax=Calcarisporiella thermophila TaxID=911321 RepID=UPI00374469FE